LDGGLEVLQSPSVCHSLFYSCTYISHVTLWYFLQLHREELHAVLVPRLDEQLAIAVGPVRNLGVPVVRVHQDPVCLAPQPVQGLKHHDGVAEIGAVDGILAVGVIAPVDVLVAKRRRMFGSEEGAVPMGRIVGDEEEDKAYEDARLVATELPENSVRWTDGVVMGIFG
jgi:hypothetical protein